VKAGTIVRLPDGREGTVVYSGLDGYGIKWGRHKVTLADIHGRSVVSGEAEAPPGYRWMPDAMLREPYPSASLECVGDDYEVMSP